MRFPGWILFAICVSLTCTCYSAQATDELMSVGVAKIDITPDYPIRMTGYQGRDLESESVEQLLWAKALAFGTDEQGPAVLITLDNCTISEAITAEIAKRLAKAKVTRERLAICASHTHCGPCISGTLPMMFSAPMPPEHQKTIDRYTGELIDNLEKVALKALADRKPAKLSWAQGKLTFALNRRNFKDGKMGKMGPNVAGVADHDFPLLRVTDADGKLRAVLVNYACHGVTLGPDFKKLCGDWIGYAQSIIEADHPGVIALVAIGCGADANPEPRTKLSHAMRQGIDVGREVDRLLAGEFRPIEGPLVCTLKRIPLPFDTLPTREELTKEASQEKKSPKKYHAQVFLDQLDRGEPLPKDISYPIQTWTFGDDLAMVFLGGEVVADYSVRLKKELDGTRLWVNAYSNDIPCYIASKRVIGEGGYETLQSMYYYGKPTQFKPEIEDTIVGTVKEMLPEWKAKP